MSGRPFILDTPEQIKKKIMSAVTDQRRSSPMIINARESAIFWRSMGVSCRDQDLASDFEGKGYGDLKTALTDVVVETLAPIRHKFDELWRIRTF